MRALVQRVKKATIAQSVTPLKPIATIGKGMLMLLGFENGDSPVSIEQMVMKIRNLRIFADADGKMNIAGPDCNAEYLLVSQFTLFADCKYGNRPSFDKAAPKVAAKEYYEHFVATSERILGKERVRHGEFGSDLLVEIHNDGPVTLWMDSHEVL